MRLIDADTLIKDLSYLYTKNHIPVDMRAKQTLSTVMEQPTAYDVDKAIDRLETEGSKIEIQYEYNYEKGLLDGIGKAIEIVKEGTTYDD